MAFKKGISGNPGGRPRGKGNKVTDKLRATITAFLTDNFRTISEEFEGMQPKDKANLYLGLLQYGLPKMQQMSMDLGFEKLSDDELGEIISQLIKQNELTKQLQHSKN